MKVLVTGAGGAIGGHLVARLLEQGHEVRAVDIKPHEEWWQRHSDAENLAELDLAHSAFANTVCRDIQWVYHLACPMGGIGWITKELYRCARSAMVTTKMLDGAMRYGCERFFLSSSACAYPVSLQSTTDVIELREDMVWPADSEPGYGLSKLYEEKLCEYARGEGLETRVARFHNCYGEHSSYNDGKEKAPAAMCRKVISAILAKDDRIEIWGDGNQLRSFMYMEDCIDGVQLIMEGDYWEPVNLGTNEVVTINQLLDIVEDIAGVKLRREYDLSAPQGVRARSSDNTLIKQRYGWEPTIPLRIGMERLYSWVWDEIT